MAGNHNKSKTILRYIFSVSPYEIFTQATQKYANVNAVLKNLYPLLNPGSKVYCVYFKWSRCTYDYIIGTTLKSDNAHLRAPKWNQNPQN